MSYVAAFALAFGSLSFEVALTRLASLLYFSPFVYVLLSVAVLGAGLGAAVAAAWPASRTLHAAAASAALAALSALAVTGAVTVLASAPARGLAMALLALPFAFTGHALATLFALRASDAPRLYFGDLLGAGTGALAVVPIANAGGPYLAIALAALVLAGASAGLTVAAGKARARPAAPWLAGASLLAAAAATFVASLGVAEPRLAALDAPKPLTLALQGGDQPLARRWDALGRTDVVRRADDGVHVLYLDGGAGSVIPEAARPEIAASDAAAFPFSALTPRSVLVIGPGGGLDVALARASGADTIVAVELNRAAVALVDDLAYLTGDVYGAGVEVLVDDGRALLERERRRFDLILMAHVVTDSAEARSMALAENGLYTLEAFDVMLERLAPGGAIAVKLYDELTLTRALLTATQALARRGMAESEAARHLLAVLDTRPPSPVPLLLVFDRALDRARAVELARAAEARRLALLFVPDLLAGPPLDALLDGDTSVSAIAAAATGVDLAPTTDARPYFFDFEPGLPRAVRPLGWTMLALVVLTFAALALRPPPRAALPPRAGPVLAALLGVAFMTVEIAALHATRLAIGHPTVAIAVTLAALLVGAGLGSGWVGDRVAAAPQPSLRAAAAAAFGAALLATAWWLAYPTLASAVAPAPTGTRAALVALSLAPPALLMGMPFPLALRVLGADTAVATAWAVNGLASVVAAVAATAVSFTWGAPAVLGVGVGCYVLAAGYLVLVHRSAADATVGPSRL